MRWRPADQSGRSSSSRPPARHAAELRLFGVAACRAVHARRPQAIRKVYLAEALIPRFRDVLAWCARERIGYRVVTDADLERLSRSQHHEGVVLDVIPPVEPALAPWLAALPAGPAQLAWLAGVGNPHNFGAMLRASANFGVAGMLLAADSRLGLSGAACRVAEGGAEHVPIVRHGEVGATLSALRAAGFSILATSSHGAESLHARPLPTRVAWLMGAEGEGLPRALLGSADRVVAIPGTGAVESLNVAGALAVLLAEHWRQHRG